MSVEMVSVKLTFINFGPQHLSHLDVNFRRHIVRFHSLLIIAAVRKMFLKLQFNFDQKYKELF